MIKNIIKFFLILLILVGATIGFAGILFFINSVTLAQYTDSFVTFITGMGIIFIARFAGILLKYKKRV